MTVDERSSGENAIWLCQRCAKAVDDDPVRYTTGLLHEWKTNAESRAREAIEKGSAHADPTMLRSILEDALRHLVQGHATTPSTLSSDSRQDDAASVLALRTAQGEQRRAWLEDEVRFEMVVTSDDDDPFSALFAINHPRQYDVTTNTAQASHLALLLRPMRYEHRQTTQTRESVQIQRVVADREPDGTPRILERSDVRDGRPQSVTDPVLSTLAIN